MKANEQRHPVAAVGVQFNPWTMAVPGHFKTTWDKGAYAMNRDHKVRLQMTPLESATALTVPTAQLRDIETGLAVIDEIALRLAAIGKEKEPAECYRQALAWIEERNKVLPELLQDSDR